MGSLQKGDTAINVNAFWYNDIFVGLKIVRDYYPISNSKYVGTLKFTTWDYSTITQRMKI